MLIDKGNRPTLMYLPLSIGPYSSDEAAAELLIPVDGRYAALTLVCDSEVRLRDHQVLSFTHDDYDAIKRDDTIPGHPGVPLAHVANFIAHQNTPDADITRTVHQLQPWPGRLNDPVPVLKRIARGQRSTRDDLRLALCDWIPGRQACTLWPLRGGEKVQLRLRRIFGAGAIDKLYLAVIRLPEQVHRQMCENKDFIDYPRWYAQQWLLSDSAGVEADAKARLLNFRDAYSFRWLQSFASGYNNNGGAITYDARAVNTLLVTQRLRNQGDLYPEVARGTRRAGLLFSQSLQLFEPSRDPCLVIPNREEILTDIEREASAANSREIYVSYYGLLRVQDPSGHTQDIE